MAVNNPPISKRRQLELDASITVYTFEDGREHRRNAYPMAAMGWNLTKMADSFNELKAATQGLLFKFEKLL